MKAINHKAAKKTFLRGINQNNNPDLIYAENNVSLNLPQQTNYGNRIHRTSKNMC